MTYPVTDVVLMVVMLLETPFRRWHSDSKNDLLKMGKPIPILSALAPDKKLNQPANLNTIKSTISKYQIPVVKKNLDQDIANVLNEIEDQSANLNSAKNSIPKYQIPVDITNLDQDIANVPNEIQSQSILIDKSVEYPSDPDLFRETILSTPLIRALTEIVPCQPGIDGKHFIFPKNKNGQSFLLKWYDKITKSNFPCKRNWLVYSPRSNKMFCFPCFLFRTISQHHYQWSDPFKGVSNFRKGHEKIVKHEQSNEHKIAEREYLILRTRIKNDSTVVHNIILARKKEKEHNRNVLKRLIDLSLFLAKNGLPFRGHRENFSYKTPNQGLFIELVKLVSKYDAVLAKHLAESNKNETYLSHMIQNDIIKSMAHETVQLILNEIKLAKYFTIIIDSTIDINKNDQFSLSLRFVDKEGKIREHFICFEELPGASASNYFNILNKCIEKYNLDFSMCRGQAYDRASTMSGRFSGLQSKVKELNPLAMYIHCCAHNFNLVLIDSIRSSVVAVSFFGTLETLYTFLTGSLPRLHILKEEQAKQVEGVILTLKKLSDTRWASHKRAVDSVYNSLPTIVKTLKQISKGKISNTKSKTVSEAQGLLFHVMKLKFSFMLVMWKNILGKAYILSNYLQNTSIDLTTAFNMITACSENIKSMRTTEHFLEIQKNAIVLCETFDGTSKFDEQRNKNTKQFFDEMGVDDNLNKSADLNFKIHTYFVILDSFVNVLNHRFEDFSNTVQQFECLDPKKYFFDKKISEKSINQLIKLSDIYQIDIDQDDLILEYESFSSVYYHLNKDCEGISTNDVLKFMITNDMISSYLNLSTLYKIFYTLPVSSATAERSFSRLKLIKTFLRSTLTEEKLSNLAILSIEKCTAEKIDFDKVIETFAQMKKRRKLL
ncbi:hypothetical protein QTP88_004574 [Uroleucon formosanum]